MNRRGFLGGVGAAALGLSHLAQGQAARDKPNLIYIMADDLGYGHLGCYGQRLIQTPHIDRLAAEGVRFTQCYAGSTVCAPSRSCLMTGQHTGHTTVRGNSAAVGGPPPQRRIPLRDTDVTVAEVLKAAGYRTGIVGKWGLGEPGTPGIPNRQGFDFWFGYLNQRHAHNYYTDYLWRNEERVTLEGNQGGRRTEYAHDLFTREALDFVRRNRERPFFLYLAYTIPHGRYQVPSLDPYADRPWSRDARALAAMITRLDRDIGRLMALLRELGLDRETVVFFTSDNGTATRGGQWEQFRGEGPFRGAKGGLYEGGIRVPMVVRWPGRIGPARTSDQVWAFWDFLPTAAEIAGAQPPASIDGISMLPAILGRPQAHQHEFLYWEFRTRGFAQAVRMGDWKAVRYGTREPLELYNLRADIAEQNNVAAGHPDIVARIEAYLRTARTPSRHWPSLERRRATPARRDARPARSDTR